MGQKIETGYQGVILTCIHYDSLYLQCYFMIALQTLRSTVTETLYTIPHKRAPDEL